MSAAPFSFWLDMSLEEPTADEIEDAVAIDVVNGIASFSDGTNSVTTIDPEKRLKVSEKLRRDTAAANPGFGLRINKMISGGAWD